MSFFELLNKRAGKFGFIDIKLSQLCAIFFILIVVKFIPEIMNINIWWFIILLVLAVIRPIYVFFFKK